MNYRWKNTKKILLNDFKQWEDEIVWTITDQNDATNGVMSKEREDAHNNDFILQEVHEESRKEVHGNNRNLYTNRDTNQIQEYTEGKHIKNKEWEYKKYQINYTLQQKGTLFDTTKGIFVNISEPIDIRADGEFITTKQKRSCSIFPLYQKNTIKRNVRNNENKKRNPCHLIFVQHIHVNMEIGKLKIISNKNKTFYTFGSNNKLHYININKNDVSYEYSFL